MKKEASLHAAICQYIRYQYPDVIFFSEPSGMRVSIYQARQLKMLRSGDKLPDLFIAEPCNGYSGMFIELKAEHSDLFKKSGGVRVSKHLRGQADMLDRLIRKGYKAVFCAGFEDSQKAVDDYLRSKT